MKYIATRRIYEPPSDDDGFRILVDRLWPRALSKEKARVDVWLKDVAPSNELRKWFGHDPARWDEFRARYKKELAGNESLAELKKLANAHPKTTLLFAAKEEEHNNAVALAEILKTEREK
jgi:uncharacterized protein YeaO (DUF488 family)